MSAAEGLQRPALEAMLPRLVPREELARGLGAGGAARHRGADRRAGAGGPADRGVRARRDVRGRRGDVPRLAGRAADDARDAAVRGRRAAERGAGPRGLALRPVAPGARGQLRRRHQRDAVRDPGRAVPGGRRPLRRAGAARAALRGRAGRRGAAHARQRLGRPRAPPGTRDRGQRRALRARDRRLRARRRAAARARRARRGRGGGRVVADLPADAVEPVDPGPDARPAGGDRAALLLDRADARHGARRRGGVGHERAVLDRRRRRGLSSSGRSPSWRCCRGSGASRPRRRSVLEVPAVREDHADPGGVGGLDDLHVALGSAGLDDRRHAGLDRGLRAVGEREERVGRERRPGQ